MRVPWSGSLRGRRRCDRPRPRLSGGMCQAVAAAVRIAETSNSSVTFSLTSTPPASRAAFQLTPQSLRLTTTLPSSPRRVLPNGSTAVPAYVEVDRDGLGDVLDREVAGDAVGVGVDRLDRRARERDRRVRLHVEEVVAAQVAVAIGVAGVDAGGLDRQLQVRRGGVLGVEVAEPSNSLNEPRTLVTIA